MNTRLLLFAILTSCISCNCGATASYGYVEVEKGASVENKTLCAGRAITAKALPESIRLGSNGRSIIVKTENDHAPVELIVGDFWSNGRCFVAVRTTKSDVNESYELYEIPSSMGPRKLQEVTLINPDFKDKVVITSYRDAARWNYESVCYAMRREVPFVCEKRQFVTEDVEKMEACLESGECGPSRLVFTGTGRNVIARISSQRASVMDRLSGGRFRKAAAYLVKNDEITLLDYQDIGTQIYYKFRYEGARKNTIGWISSADIAISAPTTVHK